MKNRSEYDQYSSSYNTVGEQHRDYHFYYQRAREHRSRQAHSLFGKLFRRLLPRASAAKAV